MAKPWQQMFADINALTKSIDRLAKISVDQGAEAARNSVEKTLKEREAGRSAFAKRYRPQGYARLIEVAKSSIGKYSDCGLGIGQYSVLSQFRNPQGKPLWFFFEEGTYQKGAVEHAFTPLPGYGIYGEGINVRLSPSSDARPHPPLAPVRFLFFAWVEAQKAISRILQDSAKIRAVADLDLVSRGMHYPRGM